MKKVIKYISSILFTVLLLFSVFKIVRVDAVDIPFELTNIEVKEKSSGVIVNDVGINLGTITNDIEFTKKDDYIKYNVTLKNTSEKDYIIKSISDDNDSTNLSYSYNGLSNTKLEALKDLTFELTITYINESSIVDLSKKKVNLMVTYEDDNGNTNSGTLTNNPDTDTDTLIDTPNTDTENESSLENGNVENTTNLGNTENIDQEKNTNNQKEVLTNVPNTADELYKYIILLVVSVIGLSITLISKKKVKKSLNLIILTMLLIPLSINADTAVFQIVFNNKIKVHEFDVSFNTNEGSNIDPLKVISGGKVTKPSNPEKENNVFMGWYKDLELNDEFNFENDTISKDTVIYAKWINGNIVKYNANGGKYTNNTTIKPIKYNITTGEVTKYSHTQNVDDTGKQLDVYGNYWNSTNIVGTDRGDTSKPHVVTIPGAESITVDIYYNSEGVNWDKVYVIEGAHPNSETYSLAQIQALVIHEFGDIQTGTYTVNGNELTNMGHETLTINGDSVTFDFISDSDSCADGYGYYAIITGTGKVMEPESIYEEPTNGSKMFAGWYKDINTTDGQEFKLNDLTGIMEVYAKWLYKITYDPNGGDLADTEEYIKVGDSITSLPQPIKFESTLLGWYDSNDNKIEVGYIPTDNLVLKAKWETNKYTISFDSKGAGDIDSITKEYNTEIGELPEPTKDNYVFGGWYLDETYEDKLTENNKVLENKTYIARWVPIYNITYNANGGKFNNNETINTTRYVYDVLEMTKVSHTQNVDDTGKKISNYGGSWNNSHIRGTGKTTPTVQAYVITIPGAESVSVDVYYNGENEIYDWATVWEGSYPHYNATYDYDKGITNGQKLGGTQSGSYTVNGNSLTNMGYRHFNMNNESVTFGFKSDGGGYGKGYGYYAIVNGKSINSYYLDNYLEPTKEKSTFVGWYKDQACTQEFNIDDFDGDIEVYAKWVYRIDLDPNGGTVTPTYLDIELNSNLVNLPTPTKNLHTFNGWFTLLDGGEKITNGYTPTENMQLYAHYTKLPVWTISFVTNGGNTLEPKEILRGGQVGELPTPIKRGFLFLGWYTDQSMTTKVSETIIPDSDVTYYANWIENDVDATNDNVTIINEYMCPNNMNITVGDGILCKRAETLHQELCKSSEGIGFCGGTTSGGYQLNSKITYGNCGTPGTLNKGDAFTCDVNGDGKFNELTERFYYMGRAYNANTKEFEDDSALLMYYNSVNNGLASNTVPHAYDANNYGLNGPVSILTHLPTTEQWSNVSLLHPNRQLLTRTGENEYDGTPLPIFSYEGYAARVPSLIEFDEACGIDVHGSSIGAPSAPLKACGTYITENTVYSTGYIEGRPSGLHVGNITDPYESKVIYVDIPMLRLIGHWDYSMLNAGVRPVIEISKERINY